MTDLIAVTHDSFVSNVTYTNPPFNLLGIETMDALVSAHQEADAHTDTRVIVTRSGLDGMFCDGLNPVTVLEADLEGRTAIFAGVSRLIQGLYSLKKPHIAVLNGPAMAGGAVFAITADFRYMDQDRGALCFAEAKVGVPVPAGLAAIIAGVCLPSMLREVVMFGKNLDPYQALAAGLVDGVAATAELEQIVQTQIARLSRLSCDVVKACKAAVRAPVLEKTANMLGESDLGFAQFLGDDYLGEGLKAFMEGRQPLFRK